MGASPRTCLSREPAGGGHRSALIRFSREAGTQLGIPLQGRVFLLPLPGLGGATGGVKDRLEDAADQAPGGRPGGTGPGLRQRPQICWGRMGGRMELAGGVPLRWAWGTHWARVGSSRHSPLEAVWPCWHRGDI